MYITKIEDDLQNNSTKMNEEKGPKDKKPAAKNRSFERPSLVNLNHCSKMYEESGSENKNIEENKKGENEKNMKESTYTSIGSYERGKQADQQKIEKPKNNHDSIQNLKITKLFGHLLFDSMDPALLAGVDDNDPCAYMECDEVMSLTVSMEGTLLTTVSEAQEG